MPTTPTTNQLRSGAELIERQLRHTASIFNRHPTMPASGWLLRTKVIAIALTMPEPQTRAEASHQIAALRHGTRGLLAYARKRRDHFEPIELAVNAAHLTVPSAFERVIVHVGGEKRLYCTSATLRRTIARITGRPVPQADAVVA